MFYSVTIDAGCKHLLKSVHKLVKMSTVLCTSTPFRDALSSFVTHGLAHLAHQFLSHRASHFVIHGITLVTPYIIQCHTLHRTMLHITNHLVPRRKMKQSACRNKSCKMTQGGKTGHVQYNRNWRAALWPMHKSFKKKSEQY